MAAGVLVWRCTPSPGSEQGQKELLCKIMQLSRRTQLKYYILSYLELIVLSVMSFHAFLSYSEPVVTTGRPWSQPLVGPCAPPCLFQIAGVSQRVILRLCSRRRQPQRNNLSSCSTTQRATKSALLLQTMQNSPIKQKVWTSTVRCLPYSGLPTAAFYHNIGGQFSRLWFEWSHSEFLPHWQLFAFCGPVFWKK